MGFYSDAPQTILVKSWVKSWTARNRRFSTSRALLSFTPNLNHGQDTRANRTRHTTSSSTQPHAKQQLMNATQTHLTFTRTHTQTPPATLPQPPPRASAPARGTIACAISTDLTASAISITMAITPTTEDAERHEGHTWLPLARGPRATASVSCALHSSYARNSTCFVLHYMDHAIQDSMIHAVTCVTPVNSTVTRGSKCKVPGVRFGGGSGGSSLRQRGRQCG